MEIYLLARDWRQVMAGEVTHPPHADHTTNMREGNFIDLTANNIGPKTGTTYQGCYRDNQTRILDVKKYQSDDNTLEKCETACREENYKLFGVESGSVDIPLSSLLTSVSGSSLSVATPAPPRTSWRRSLSVTSPAVETRTRPVEEAGGSTYSAFNTTILQLETISSTPVGLSSSPAAL